MNLRKNTQYSTFTLVFSKRRFQI